MVKHAPPAQMVALQSSIECITDKLHDLDTSLHSEMMKPEDAFRQLTSIKTKVNEHNSLLDAQVSHLAEINTRITSLEDKASGHGGIVAKDVHLAEALDKGNEHTSNHTRNLASPPLAEHTLTDHDWLEELLAWKIKEFPDDQPFIDQFCRPRFEQWSPHQLHNLRDGVHDGLSGGDREMLNKLFAQRVSANAHYVGSPMTESQKLAMSHAHGVGPSMTEFTQRAMAGAHVVDPLMTESVQSVLGSLYQPHIDDPNVTSTYEDVITSHVDHPEALDEGNEPTSKDASSTASPAPIQFTFPACPEDYAGRPLPDWVEEYFAARISCDPLEQKFIDDFLRPQFERWLPQPHHFEELRPGIQNGIFFGFKSDLGGDRGHFINGCKCFEDQGDKDTIHRLLSAVEKLSKRLTQLEDTAKLNPDNKDGRVDLACALVEKVSNRLTKLEKSRSTELERANHHLESVMTRIASVETDTKEKFSKSNLFLTELEEYVDDFQSDVVDKTGLQDEQISALELKIGDFERCLAKVSETSAATSAAAEGEATKSHDSCNARHQGALACQMSCRVRIAKLEAELGALTASSYLEAHSDNGIKESRCELNTAGRLIPEVTSHSQKMEESAISKSSYSVWPSDEQQIARSGDLEFADFAKKTRLTAGQKDQSTKRSSLFDPPLTYEDPLAKGKYSSLVGSPRAFQAQLVLGKQEQHTKGPSLFAPLPAYQEQLAMGKRSSLFSPLPAFQGQLAVGTQDGPTQRFSLFDPPPGLQPQSTLGDHTAKTEYRPAPSHRYDSAAQGALFPLYPHEHTPLASSTQRHEQPISTYSADPSHAAQLRALHYEDLNAQTTTQQDHKRHARVEDWPDVDDDHRAASHGYFSLEAPGKWSLAHSSNANAGPSDF